jgi:hypothetical protein
MLAARHCGRETETLAHPPEGRFQPVDAGPCYLLKNLFSSEELGDQHRRSRASPNPWLIGLCFDVVIGSKSVL